MEEAPKDPLDISKEVDLVKEAQEDLSKNDVLICGGCHEVFYFVEEFNKHKEGGACTNVSILKCENEEKTQIWGFTLWKCKQVKTHRSNGEEPPSSWEIYQKWTKLDQNEKDLWITGGRTLQFLNKIATGKIREIKEEKKIEKDPLAFDEEIIESEGSKRGVRTNKESSCKEEYNVEKILGKRFNPRKRYWEYEVKWESYKDSTWEPLSHLENCKALVTEFEEKLKAEKEAKEKEKVPGRGRGRPRLNPDAPHAVKAVKKPSAPATPTLQAFISSPGGRPQRTSKQKALNQVKAWCGNMSDEEGGGGTKRPLDDDFDSDDSYERRMKLEGDDDDTEEDEPRPPVRKVAKIIHTYNNNGAGKTAATQSGSPKLSITGTKLPITATKLPLNTGKLPDNVLIPDAKGVVRISQKQLPSLSSGVYIMSKSSGIIKLDPTASKIATSGGQAIVKVSPKIGQTQIKIIKKEDGSKRVVEVKKEEASGGAPKAKVVTSPPIGNRQSILKKDGERIMKKIEVLKAKPIEKKEEKKPSSAGNDEESDDGIPDWEFPADMPLPGPDSPPGEFILDPITGKLAGVEYPDPEPEPVINEETEKKDEEEKEEDPAKDLDNIVKIAAADITEDDLKTESEVTEAAVTTTENTSTTNAPSVSVTTQNEVKTTQSILTTAIVNSNILQKTLQSPNPKPKTHPRIINQAVARPRTSMSPIARTQTHPSPIRPRHAPPPKPKFNIAPMTQRDALKSPAPAKTNNIVRKVNNTTTNVYTKKVVPSPQGVKKPPPQKPVAPVTPKPVISMPSLDEEPVVLQQVVQPVAAPPTKASEEAEAALQTDLSTFTLAPGDRPMFITGDDGTVYQVAGQNEEGQTILVTQDSDGQQQCLLVTSEALQEEGEQVINPGEVQLMEVQEPVDVGEEQPLVAQFIRTEPPSPGGTHKVVVMLPDGDVMVTQVTPEEYASLELDK